MPNIKQIIIPQTVTVRKYEVDVDSLKLCLNNHKCLNNRQISQKLNIPITKVEHWFRKDNCFSISDSEYWYQLKDLLDIRTDIFDESIMTFEQRIGNYERSERCYLTKGISPTLDCACGNIKVIYVKDN